MLYSSMACTDLKTEPKGREMYDQIKIGKI
jgi:hypothetical protein